MSDDSDAMWHGGEIDQCCWEQRLLAVLNVLAACLLNNVHVMCHKLVDTGCSDGRKTL